MRRLSIIAWIGSLLLSACGGNTLTGSTSTTGTTTNPAVASMTVSSSSPQVSADGTTSATITAVAKDGSNNFIKGVTVAFTSSAGGVAITQAVTDANGQALATLTAKGVASGTSITVTASASGASGKVTVAVVSTQETVALTTNSSQIPSDGSKAATISALITDANNNLVPGVLVNFTASSGGLTLLVPADKSSTVPGTTGANGTALATLIPASDPSNRVITVTATANGASATVQVSVIGTTLSVVGPPNLVQGAMGTYTISLTNSSTAGIPNTPVTLTSANGNTLTPSSVVTDATGQKTFTVTAKNSGADTITATALGLTASQTLSVSNQSFQFTTPSTTTTNVNLTSVANPVNQTLAVTWVVGGVPQTGKTVNFSATRGTLSAAQATTDGTGTATVTISSSVAGPAVVTASATGVTTQTTLDFIANVPAAIAVQASPATIPTQGQSTITAVVRDANNNLVQNQTVDFQTVNDITRGSLSVASAVTDVQGRAQTVYTASSTASASNGVVIQATVQGTAISQTANLTVGGLSVFLSLGTGNKIAENSPQTQFIVPYTVIALDAGGNPVSNQPITLTIHPLYYYKGGYVLSADGKNWVQTGNPGSSGNPGSYTAITACANEDANFNGVLDPGEDGCDNSGKSLDPPYGVPAAPYTCNPTGNGNQKLDPGGTAVASPASVVTGSDGSAAFSVIYPEDQANWVAVQLIATTTVQGTETTASTTFVLPILASYITTTTASPPGVLSPYGTAQVCTNPN